MEKKILGMGQQFSCCAEDNRFAHLLQQERAYTVLSRQEPEDFALLLRRVDGEAWQWVTEAGGEPVDANVMTINLVTGEEIALHMTPCRVLIMSAGAHCAPRVNHILDGSSMGIAVRTLPRGELQISQKIVSSDYTVFRRERDTAAPLSYGLFTGEVAWWERLLCCGRVLPLMCGSFFPRVCPGSAVEKQTAHQPIYFPRTESAIYCSPSRYHAFRCHFEGPNGTLQLVEDANGWPNRFPSGHYLCMHPHFDPSTNRLLTYSFHHAALHRFTSVSFFEFGDAQDADVPVIDDFAINERVALHMFGFTENYFVVFANPLRLSPRSCDCCCGPPQQRRSLCTPGGQCRLLCDTPILRALDHDYCPNLVIYFVPRRGAREGCRRFSIDTQRQGYVYHAINCFEVGSERIVIDAFVSQVNSARESSQFELHAAGGRQRSEPVFDNHGDAYRFVINVPAAARAVADDPYQPRQACNERILSSLMDSTIDFHCINANHSGRRHRYAWMVGHERQRNADTGELERTLSHLYKIDIETDTIDFNPNNTTPHHLVSTQWNSGSCYLRTPMFVPSTHHADREDSGYIVVWSFESANRQRGSPLAGTLLMIDATDLSHLRRIVVPRDVPYTVHSFSYYESGEAHDDDDDDDDDSSNVPRSQPSTASSSSAHSSSSSSLHSKTN
jgi:carotenoid cleavage dioxygenase-like enzyme